MQTLLNTGKHLLYCEQLSSLLQKQPAEQIKSLQELKGRGIRHIIAVDELEERGPDLGQLFKNCEQEGLSAVLLRPSILESNDEQRQNKIGRAIAELLRTGACLGLFQESRGALQEKLLYLLDSQLALTSGRLRQPVHDIPAINLDEYDEDLNAALSSAKSAPAVAVRSLSEKPAPAPGGPVRPLREAPATAGVAPSPAVVHQEIDDSIEGIISEFEKAIRDEHLVTES